MKRSIGLVLVVAGGFLACGDSSGSSTPEKTPEVIRELPPASVKCGSGAGTLSGRFLAPNGETPIVGALASISSADCVAATDAAGRFSLEGLPQERATIQLRKGIFAVSQEATLGEPIELKIAPDSARLAYVPGSYDSVEEILRRLGFEPEMLSLFDLGDADLSGFDGLFLNCGMGDLFDEGDLQKLRAFVSAGGALYASDWSSTTIANAFPDRIRFIEPSARIGNPGEVVADVHDDTFRRVLGRPTASISFDLGGWAVMEPAPAGTDVLLSGLVETMNFEEIDWENVDWENFDWEDFEAGLVDKSIRPLSVQFREGKGRVTYTSFHNEAQNTDDADLLLEQLIFNL